MNYPKMLYKGEAKYTDNDQLRNDLFSKELKTIIVSDVEQEEMRREQGYVDLADLMYKPKQKVAAHEEDEEGEVSVTMQSSRTVEPMSEVRTKRKYTRRVQTDVGNDTA